MSDPVPCLWTVACQASLSMGFSRQEYWSRLPCPPSGDLPKPGIEPASLISPVLAGGFFTTSTTWEAPPPPSCSRKQLFSSYPSPVLSVIWMQSHIISLCVCQFHTDLTNQDILTSLSIYPGSFHLEFHFGFWEHTSTTDFLLVNEKHTYSSLLPSSCPFLQRLLAGHSTVVLNSTKDHFLKSCSPLCVCVFSRVWLFETPWTVARQAPLHGIFPARILEQVAFPPPGDLPKPGIDLASPALQAGSLPLSHWVDLFGSLICFQSSKIICEREQRASLGER